MSMSFLLPLCYELRRTAAWGTSPTTNVSASTVAVLSWAETANRLDWE